MSQEKLIEYLIVLAGLVGTWAVMRYKLDSHSRQIEKLWTWKDNHEAEAGKERLTIYQGISKLEGLMDAKSKENVEIIRRLENIDTTLMSMREDMATLKARRVHD